MSVEGMSRINNSYQGQGSSTSANVSSQTAAVSAAAPVERADSMPKKDDIEITNAAGYEKREQGNIREEGQASDEQIRQAVDKINKEALGNSEAVFGIHDKTNRVTIKIVDKETKEVIKEFPPEKTLDMIARVWEMAGIMIDERR